MPQAQQMAPKNIVVPLSMANSITHTFIDKFTLKGTLSKDLEEKPCTETSE